MATVFSEGFEGGTSGATVTTANSGFGAVDAGWTFATTPAPFNGSLNGTVTVAASVTSMGTITMTTQPLYFRRFFMYMTAYPQSISGFSFCRNAGVIVANLRLGITGTVQVRDATTTVFTSTALALNTWHRLEWRLDDTNNQQQLRVYSGGNANGATADQDSGSVALTGAGPDDLRLGIANGSGTTGATVVYDAIVDDDTTWPGPIAAVGPVTVQKMPPNKRARLRAASW